MSPVLTLTLAVVLMTVCTTANRLTAGFQSIGPSVVMLVAFWYAWTSMEAAATAWPWGLTFAVWAGASGALAVGVGAALGETLSAVQAGLTALMAASAVGLGWTLLLQSAAQRA